METEPFTVGMRVIWYRGEEMGATIQFGEIAAVNGPIRTGTLKCRFQNGRGWTQKFLFKKEDGRSLDEDGYIRLSTLYRPTTSDHDV